MRLTSRVKHKRADGANFLLVQHLFQTISAAATKGSANGDRHNQWVNVKCSSIPGANKQKRHVMSMINSAVQGMLAWPYLKS